MVQKVIHITVDWQFFIIFFINAIVRLLDNLLTNQLAVSQVTDWLS